MKIKNGSWRLCADYRKLNDSIRKEVYQLPRVNSRLESLGESSYLSLLDLRFGYYQMELDPEDADKTACVTRSDQYRFTVLSMRLAKALSQFQRLMVVILSGILRTC